MEGIGFGHFCVGLKKNTKVCGGGVIFIVGEEGDCCISVKRRSDTCVINERELPLILEAINVASRTCVTVD